MYKYKRSSQAQHVSLLFKLLLISSALVFIVPMFIGVIHKYFQVIDVQMVMWISSLSITLGVLSYLVTIFTLFNLLYWGNNDKN